MKNKGNEPDSQFHDTITVFVSMLCLKIVACIVACIVPKKAYGLTALWAYRENVKAGLY